MTDPHSTAPWTQDQVLSLNNFQASNIMHSFTCGNDDCRKFLVATTDGWKCSNEFCTYTQKWAHTFMIDACWSTQ